MVIRYGEIRKGRRRVRIDDEMGTVYLNIEVDSDLNPKQGTFRAEDFVPSTKLWKIIKDDLKQEAEKQ
jgi:hypothetical protein